MFLGIGCLFDVLWSFGDHDPVCFAFDRSSIGLVLTCSDLLSRAKHFPRSSGRGTVGRCRPGEHRNKEVFVFFWIEDCKGP